MVQSFASRSKSIACFFAVLIYLELLLPLYARAEYKHTNRTVYSTSASHIFKGISQLPAAPADQHTAPEPALNRSVSPEITRISYMPQQTFGGGPGQPEMQAFTSVNNANMVELFSGDFSYNIPLLDVGGYPVNLAYRSGVSMDQEASWVGLGWNVNPGTVTRNMRGLPDDFNGNDSIKKITSMKENRTVGITVGGGAELKGLPLKLSASLGIFNNSYKGWGLETGLNASINAGQTAKGPLSGGLSITNNSQNGVTFAPSLSINLAQQATEDRAGASGGFTVSSAYNSREGIKGLQTDIGIRQSSSDTKNQRSGSMGSSFSSWISFASPSYTPSMSIPYTSSQYSFTVKLGQLVKVFDPHVSISGYNTRQRIDAKDTLVALPAYGYMHYQDGRNNRTALLDINREKELVYRDKPATPHIAVPVYTYDAFSITGEGTGGMFRAYRSDIGFVRDPFMRTKDESLRYSADIGVGDLVHGGVDLNVNRAYTQNSGWLEQNSMKNVIGFKDNDRNFEAVYFKNPSEKAMGSQAFFKAIGDDDLVSVNLYQSDKSSPIIQATNKLTRYRNKRTVGTVTVDANTIKKTRDKRSQVISYLTAKEAQAAGHSRYIENYTVNIFDSSDCREVSLPVEGEGNGLTAQYFRELNYQKLFTTLVNTDVNIHRTPDNPPLFTGFPKENFSVRWTGRIKAPVSGQYTFTTKTDDGVTLWINDSSIIRDTDKHLVKSNSATLNLIQGETYTIRMDYFNAKGFADAQLNWSYPGKSDTLISKRFLYSVAKDTFPINNYLVKENRVNSFRKEHHISEVNVLNTDGRTYVYGIPVYNFKQKEATFSIDGVNRSNKASGLAGYTDGADNTAANNKNGKDNYFSSEEVPAYAHSFLLSGILSADYVDITGNGISNDDYGDAVRFNYSKVSGVINPYKWRAPFIQDSVTLNEGLKTDNRDDKGSYVYGEKELWYMHSIESKTMIATFTVGSRQDVPSIDERGSKQAGNCKRLIEINLYSRADFLKSKSKARPIKTVHFDYSYELCKGVNKPMNDSGKLTLKKIWFTYNGNEKRHKNPYVFHYNSNNPNYNTKSYDRWGNYKNPVQNPGSTAADTISNADYIYALQDSLEAARNAAAWALDSIILPSGGAMKVAYESDDYAYVQHKRAMQMCKLLGLGSSPAMQATPSNKLYTGAGDNLYLYISVPQKVQSGMDVYRKYLSEVRKIYFRLFVKMPSDMYGSGYEYVPGYADIDESGGYGRVNDSTIWIKVSGISLKGDEPGNFSPLAKTAIQFLRLNLSSKAYPNSEVGNNLNVGNTVRMVGALGWNLINILRSFDASARLIPAASQIDVNRSYIRLNDADYRKLGGGHRVKRITIYDNWNKMTGQTTSLYGKEYTYTTKQEIFGVTQEVSSGVASYEPGIGGEENPFRQPIEYDQKIAPLAPVTLGYSEEPLGESFFPSAGVGYSKVRTRTINYKNKKSANGYDETMFYTAYDFPTYTDRTLLDVNTKKRFNPKLSNFLRINARHYLALSQGFKIELNDMHGKLRSQASYAETSPDESVTYTENIYKVEDMRADQQRLATTAMVMHPDGKIDSAGIVGKDIELMVDMREQQSVTNGYNVNVNVDAFSIPVPPFLFALPGVLNLAQREENLFRSVATVKVIQRYGILDSVVHIDKGSRVATENVLYDSETGDVLLTRTKNEFNDPVYNFQYPAHWAYDGMGPAYKNIDVVLNKVNIRNGKISPGLAGGADTVLFSSGDEVLVAGKQKTGPENAQCTTPFASFPSYDKAWVIDSNVLRQGPKTLYFIDRDGKPYSGTDISLKVIRSGRRNMNGSCGSITSLENPLVYNSQTSQYNMLLNTNTKIVNAASNEYRQFWNVEDVRKKKTAISCVSYYPDNCTTGGSSCVCTCLRKLFDYLIASGKLFLQHSDNVTVNQLVQLANAAGYQLSTGDCSVLEKNKNKLFYALTTSQTGTNYRAALGDCIVTWNAPTAVNFSNLTSIGCDSTGKVYYKGPSGNQSVDTVNTTLRAAKSLNYFNITADSGRVLRPRGTGSLIDTVSENLVIARDGNQYLVKNNLHNQAELYASHQTGPNTDDRLSFTTDNGFYNLHESIYTVKSFLKFDSISFLPPAAQIQQATLYLFGFTRGFSNPQYTRAHSIPPPPISIKPFTIARAGSDWNYQSTVTHLDTIAGILPDSLRLDSAYQDFQLDIRKHVSGWRSSSGNTGLYMYINYQNDTAVYNTFFSPHFDDPRVMPKLELIYTIPSGNSTVDSTIATLEIESCPLSCDTIAGSTCNSIVTDTISNPYISGMLGNWRSNKSYTYYGKRSESDPIANTDIRTNGTFREFVPFWTSQPSGLKPTYDTTRWVWNSEITLMNRKGMEIENKDPLGRYNAGLYGYNLSLPTAVIQNGRYRESAFEGFEDYGYSTQVCDAVCAAERHIDFSTQLSRFDTLYKHSGKSSLRVPGNDYAALTFPLTNEQLASVSGTLKFTTQSLLCAPNTLRSVQASNGVLLPAFSPFAGKKMVVSAWVREERDCSCASYANNRIVVVFNDGAQTQVILLPSGNIIEGWQRYDAPVSIPALATTMTVSLQATGAPAVYFDDLRIHPFNANMKSYVYNPINLRLMAELDENNYATFYEYDDEGTLIRLKKETERGVQTIKETRSALLKH